MVAAGGVSPDHRGRKRSETFLQLRFSAKVRTGERNRFGLVQAEQEQNVCWEVPGEGKKEQKGNTNLPKGGRYKEKSDA